jgi:hypothetical protein
MPPLRLEVLKGEAKKTPLAHLGRAKLVTHCRDEDRYEQYNVQEYLLYRVYALFTPLGHLARPARITYVDSARGKQETRYGFLLEDPRQLAVRNGGKLVQTQGATSDDLDPFQTTLFAVFEYFIGNTDWSVPALHNVELVQANMTIYPVPYDYDYSGVINTHYAAPDERLHIHSVRDRLYRGYCATNAELPRVLALFKEKKDAIYALYRTQAGLRPENARRALEYYDEFYRTINDPSDVRQSLERACRPG